MQVLVPGDFTPQKGKYLGIQKSEDKDPKKSIEKGIKWYSYKKDEDYSWRMNNIASNSPQGKLLRNPELTGDPIRGFIAYKGWMDKQIHGAQNAKKFYDNR